MPFYNTLPHAPKISSPDEVTPEIARQLERACDGGCLNAFRSGLEYVIYAPKKNLELPFVVIIGSGIPINGTRYWFDREGKPYTEQEIRSMKDPIVTLGNCASVLEDAAAHKTTGCCAPSAGMLAATGVMQIPFPLLSFKNKTVAHFGLMAVHMILSRTWSSLRGKWIDCPSQHINQIYPVPNIPEEVKDFDYLQWPLPYMDWKTRLKMAKDQLHMMKLKY